MREARIEHALQRAALRWPQKPALEFDDQALSFAHLWSSARARAAWLVARGVQPGDRVAICGRKSPAFVAALYGIWRAGAVAVPISVDLRPIQLAHILRKSGARLLLHDRRFRVDPSSVQGPEPLLDLGSRELAPLSPGDLPALLEPPELSELSGQTQSGSASDELSSDELGSDELGSDELGSDELGSDELGSDALAILLFTSGSTGMPKGIMISHRNLIAGARIVCTYLQIEEFDRLLSVLPFHFDYGLNQLLCSVRMGATLVLQRSVHPGSILSTLQDREITLLAGVPPLWAQLFAEASPVHRMELPQLSRLTNSGGAFPLELLQVARGALPNTEFFLMYGLSEAFRSTYLPPSEIEGRPSSMGRAIPESEIFVINRRGQPCEHGEVGELVHRGPTVAMGYWDDPEATARVFRSDPFDSDARGKVVYSGDQVRSDQEGFLYFVGRRDQQLKSFGHRVNPEEVEAILQGCALVHLVVVGARPHPVAGHGIVAHIEPSEQSDGERIADNGRASENHGLPPGAEAQLRDYCRAHMPPYMVPREFFFHTTLPLTSSGKVNRKAILS